MIKSIPEDDATKERVGLFGVLVCACVRVQWAWPGRWLLLWSRWAERVCHKSPREAHGGGGKTSDGSISASSSVPDFCLQPRLLTGWAPTGSPPSYTLAGVEEPGDIVVFFSPPRRNKLKTGAHGRSDDSRVYSSWKSLRPASCCYAASDPAERFWRRIPWDTGWIRLSWHCCWEWWVALLCGWTWIWLGWILAGRKLSTNAHQQSLGISGRESGRGQSLWKKTFNRFLSLILLLPTRSEHQQLRMHIYFFWLFIC